MAKDAPAHQLFTQSNQLFITGWLACMLHGNFNIPARGRLLLRFYILLCNN